MKYVVNTRGGAKMVQDNLLDSLLSQGCTQITLSQFNDKKYYPEYDRGMGYQVPSAPTPTLQAPVKSQRESFKTRIV